MRTLSSPLTAALNSPVISLAYCWLITRSDGVKLGFTSADIDIKIETITYKSFNGITPTATTEATGLTVNNVELSSFFDDEGITEKDVLAGVYDSARVLVFLCDYTNPPTSLTSTDYILLINGVLGNITKTNLTYKAELRGLSQYLAQSVTNLTSRTCRYKLGSSKCGVNLALYTSVGSVTNASSRKVFTIDLVKPLDYYSGGTITFTSGLNQGHSLDIYSHSLSTISLYELTPYPINIGDTFSISAGCDKTLGTCKSKFNNGINFGGEPFLDSPSSYLYGKFTK